MSNTNLRFQRIDSSTINSFVFTQGTIYFNDADNLIYVGTGNGTGTSYCKVYSGARDINWDESNSVLTFTNASGINYTIDFDNLVDFDDFAALRDGIGLVKTSGKYVFSANGIADTSYLDSSDSSTVIGALKSLDTAVSIARQNAGVISFGGKTGIISVKDDNTTTGTINFSMDGSTLNASIVDSSSAAYKTVEYFVGIENSTDASTNDTIKGAKKYTKEVLGQDGDVSTKVTVYGTRKYVSEVLGQDGDVSTKVTVHGAIQKAKDVKTELLGTSGDASTVTTIYGVQKKAEAVKTELFGSSVNDTSTSKTIEGLVMKTDAMETNAAMHLYSGESGSTTATTVTADGQTYRLVQGETTIAKFNIEKDSFVSDGSVVKHDTSSEPWGPAGTYIQLALRTTDTSTGTSSEKTIYIPAESLVDSYTAYNEGKNVTVTVDNDTNKISATVATSDGVSQLNFTGTDVTLATIAGKAVKAKLDTLAAVAENTEGGVQLSESGNVLSASLINNAVTTAKILDANVTTAKIADQNVTEAKLSADVSTKLNNAVQVINAENALGTDSSFINVRVTATREDGSTFVRLSTSEQLTFHDVSTSAVADANNGIATAYNVKDYVQTYVSEQLTWAAWPSQA